MRGDAPRAVVLVRNTATHDARVLRCAKTLCSLDYETVVVAVTSAEEKTERAMSQGVPVIRLTPRAPLAGPARVLRRLVSRPAGGRPSLARATPAEPVRSAAGPVGRAYRLLRTLSYYRHGVAAVWRLRPSLVHCNDYNTVWIGVAAKLLLGSTLVYDSHELWPDRNRRSEPAWWLLVCEALFLRIADLNLATSPGHADVIARRHGVGAPRVVRNIAERPAATGDKGITTPSPRAARTIVYSGALTESRGLEQAIAALQQTPDVDLRLIGPGALLYRESLSALAVRSGVGERVRIEPPVAPERVVETIRSCGAGLALIQPTCVSYALCLPNKLFEYMVAGLPVLAADLPAIRAFVVPNRLGLVTPPADIPVIARAMRQILEPGLNRGLRAAAARAAAEHSWEREAERLRDLYRDAAGSSAEAR
jgi:glycosyltransferase involved in cell wall biosynthesis